MYKDILHISGNKALFKNNPLLQIHIHCKAHRDLQIVLFVGFYFLKYWRGSGLEAFSLLIYLEITG